MSYRYSVQRPPRRRSCINCIIPAAVVTIILLTIGLGYVRPRLSDYVGEQLSRGGNAQQQIESQIDENVPNAVAGLPSGEVSVTTDQVNSYVSTYADQIDLVESATVQLVPGQLQAQVQALGTENNVTAELAVQEGQVVVVNPRIDGPLGVALSAESLAQSLQSQINAQLAAQGQTVQDIRIEQDRVVVVTE